MVKTAIFASGSGTNFENLVLRMQDGTIPNAVCELLVVDKENAKARERADRLGIDHIYVNPKAYAGKKEYEQEIRRHLEEKGVQLIILAGYMRFIGEELLTHYPRRIINIHPAYLPAFPGAHGIRTPMRRRCLIPVSPCIMSMRASIPETSSRRKSLPSIRYGHWKRWRHMCMRWNMSCFRKS